MAGQQIVEKLIENSETFQQKTKFSQAKFLKKKAKKYHHYIMVRKPSIRLLMEIHYTADPMKLLNLRIDTLAQILHAANVRSGGKFIVYETGAQGIVVAAMLERLGSHGRLTHIYQVSRIIICYFAYYYFWFPSRQGSLRPTASPQWISLLRYWETCAR